MPRYIDAEPFEGMHIMKSFDVEINETPYSTIKSYTVTEYARVKDVDDVPTADVQEVKHGKWDYGQNIFPCFCSECGQEADMVYAYCPHCGARMDGK